MKDKFERKKIWQLVTTIFLIAKFINKQFPAQDEQGLVRQKL